MEENMKLFKILLLLFIVTLIFSSAEAFADNNWYFAGITISSSSDNYPYVSSGHEKIYPTEQSFYLSSCKDKVLWKERNIRVAIRDNNTSQHDDTFSEMEVGDTKVFNDAYTKKASNFSLVFRIANPLVNSLYFSGTWYID